MTEKISLSAPQAQPSQTQPRQSEQDAVPTDVIPLPSEGRVYPSDHPLHLAKGIEIRSMTAREEDILTSRPLLRSGRAISMLLRSCIVNKSIDVDKMLAGDRNAALIGIRITGYGPEYNVTINCPACGEKVDKSIDLSSLNVKPFPDGIGPRQEGTNEFEFLLPVSKRRVVFKLFTGDEERELLQIIEKKRKEGLPEDMVTTRHQMQIISIDGEQDRTKLSRLIPTMTAQDSRALRFYVDRISPGVEMTVPFACPSCDFEDKGVEVPIGAEFFWPKA